MRGVANLGKAQNVPQNVLAQQKWWWCVALLFGFSRKKNDTVLVCFLEACMRVHARARIRGRPPKKTTKRRKCGMAPASCVALPSAFFGRQAGM
jgi:hypothetical protein